VDGQQEVSLPQYLSKMHFGEVGFLASRAVAITEIQAKLAGHVSTAVENDDGLLDALVAVALASQNA